MKVMARIGASITVVDAVLMLVLTMSQQYVPFWVLPILFYGITLVMTAGFFAHWKKWELKRNGRTRLKEAEVFTTGESARVLIIAFIVATTLSSILFF
jgi:hypothetical protein